MDSIHSKGLIMYLIAGYSRLWSFVVPWAVQASLLLFRVAHKHVPNDGAQLKRSFKKTIYVEPTMLLRLLMKLKVPKMAMISTKYNPPNMLGATKRVGWVDCHGFNQRSQSTTQFRFGNVLAAVVVWDPVFERQIAEGDPVAVMTSAWPVTLWPFQKPAV